MELKWTDFYDKLNQNGRNCYSHFLDVRLSQDENFPDAWWNAFDDLQSYTEETLQQATGRECSIQTINKSAAPAHPRMYMIINFK